MPVAVAAADSPCGVSAFAETLSSPALVIVPVIDPATTDVALM
jgi:hypothetical protein